MQRGKNLAVVTRTVAIAAMWCLARPSAAFAAPTFHFAVDQPVYTAAPGGSVPVTLMLVEERAVAGDPSLLVDEQGVFGFDLKVDRQSGTARIADITGNTAVFSNLLVLIYQPTRPLPADGVNTAEFAISALDSPGPTGTQDGLRRTLVLGTVTLHAPLAPGDSSIFSILDSDLGTNTVTNRGTALDSLISAGSFSVQSVPEPSTLLLIVSSAGAMFLRRRLKMTHPSQALSETPF